MRALPAVLMRGGTSRGVIFHAKDLAAVPEAELEAIFARCVGSPDPSNRQVDGVGGGNATTSKVAVVAPSHRPDADVDYMFYQIDVATGAAGTRGNCGNLTSAVGHFAVAEGLVAAREPVTRVRIYNINTKRYIWVDVPVRDGRPLDEGDYVLAGVPGSGAPIRVSFRDPGGAVSGRLLPTGAAAETVAVHGRKLLVTVIDAVNPTVLVDAHSLGVSPTIAPDQIEADAELMRVLELVRGWGAVRLGLADEPEKARTQSPVLPFVGITAPPQAYTTMGGQIIAGEDVDVIIRMLSMRTAHRAVPLGAGVATAVAACVQGSTACRRPELIGSGVRTVRLGHPTGILSVDVEVGAGADRRIEGATLTLTARRIMQGVVFA